MIFFLFLFSVLLDANGSCQYPQGHAMGGSTAVNLLAYIRGNRADYDEWAALGNHGWSYDDLLPYFRRGENISIPELMDSPYHSTKGELNVSYSNYDNQFIQAFLKAGNEFGLETLDYNGKEQIGINYIQQTMTAGTTRCSASKAYLQPIRYRRNLYIFKNTLVTRIIFDKTNRTAIGVECYRNGKYFTITSTKEVIITAGAINTPKLLMLSGVGPRRHLEELGIPVIADLPVGETLVNHVYIPMYFSVDPQLLAMYNISSYEAILDYAKNRRGVLTTIIGLDVVAFFTQESRKYHPPDVEVFLGTLFSMDTGPNISLVYLSVAVLNLRPKSIGTLRLKTRNFQDPPIIDPNYFANELDMEITKWGMHEVFKLINMHSLAKYNMKWSTTDSETYCGNIDANNDEDLDCYIKFNSHTVYHPVATCKMGAITDKTSVVDPSLKVHGTANLRLAGSPIFPTLIRGHTNPAAIVTGEKLADILFNSYR
ncbi:glucose dehydrogenase [FAD, quinone]-like [Rhodnius prolixus]|uniref:glucose dehydrogenase [FAD, quinone]-like n=1 Tax=Rhodnius prolixus TaxID=13249 RepID=UPI003D18B980